MYKDQGSPNEYFYDEDGQTLDCDESRCVTPPRRVRIREYKKQKALKEYEDAVLDGVEDKEYDENECNLI